MNLRDIAKLANVSISTVSKAFNNADDISEETRERIFEIAKENGCYGKYHRDHYDKKVIAVICPEITSSYYCNMIELIQKAVNDRGGEVIISTDGFDQKKKLELIEYHASYSGVDGIIVYSLQCNLPKYFDVPIISIGNSVDRNIDSIIIHTNSAVNNAIACLKANGHHNIALITEKLTSSRKKQFEEAMINNRLEPKPEYIFTSNRRFEDAGKQGIEELFKTGHDFSAVVCSYDYIALGAINKLDEMGLRVPEDVSVVSMLDNSLPKVTKQGISSIKDCSEELCELACELIYKKFKNKFYHTNKHIELIATFIDRGTIGPNKRKDNGVV